MEDKRTYKSHVNPLRFMWIAHFKDGTSLPEFDPYLYKKNKVKDVLERGNELIKFGIYPIPPKLAKELNRREIEDVISVPFFPKYEINFDSHKKLIFFRRNFIHSETYYKCNKCRKEFQEVKYTDGIQKSLICPHCSARDYWKCKKCGKEYKRFDDAPNHMCECGAHLKRIRIVSGQFARERRDREVHFGYQETVSGVNIKYIMKIDQEGNVEVI